MKLFIMKFLLLLVFVIGIQNVCYPEIYCKIKGRVLDKDTKKGIPNVYVNAHQFVSDYVQDFYVLTDEDGYFTFSNLKEGRYLLNYSALFPYASFPYLNSQRTDGNRAFHIRQGEVKNFIQELEKGGEIVCNFHLKHGDISEYLLENYSFHHLSENKFERDVYRISHKRLHPNFQKIHDGIKYTGLISGNYVISMSFRKMQKFYSGDDVEYAGVIKEFFLEKMGKKNIILEYNSDSRLHFKSIKGTKESLFLKGLILVYKEVVINNEKVFFSVWEHDYRKGEVINHLIVEPGEYYILFFNGKLIKTDGTLVNFDTNEFIVSIAPNEVKSIDFVLEIDGKFLPQIDESTKFIR